MKDEPSPGELWWLFISQTAGLVGYSIKQLIYLSEDARAKSLDYEARQRLSKLIPTDELHTKATEIIRAANFPSVDDFTSAIYKQFITRKRIPSFWISNAFFNIAIKLYGREELTEQPLHKVVTGEIERGRYNDHLIQLVQKAIYPEKTLSVITSTIFDCIDQFISVLPPVAFDENWKKRPEEDTLHISLIDVIPDVPLAITALTSPFEASDDIEALNLFESLRKALLENRKEISDTRVIQPADHRGSSHELVKAYLKNTILEPMFDVQIPFSIPDERMLEHCAIVAGSGHGKTQLLQTIVYNFLKRDDPPSVVVIDSTGAMIQRIQHLAMFSERLADRLLIIDPELDPPPALNMFDMTNERMKGYTGLVREEVESELIELFNYVFASIAREMTGRQSTAFSYIVRLMLSIPNANVHTLRILLSDDAKGYEQSKFKAEIEKLDDVAIEFFRTFFYSTGFRATRTQVLERLLGLLRVPVFNRMFSSRNKLDMYDAMQKGQIVLVNTSARLLKEQASALFGRYIISRTLAGAFERAAIPERQRKPAFLIVDEAAPYFDATFETLLTRVRQLKLGVTVAFQHLEQLDDKLRSAIASNTSVKYAGGLGYTDSRFLARDMETTPEFLKAQRKSDKQTQFACYVRSFTDTAVSLTVPFGLLESQPRMTAEQHAALLQRNCERVTHTEPVASVATSPVIDELAKDLMKVYTDQVARNSDTSVSKPGAKTQSEPWESGTTW